MPLPKRRKPAFTAHYSQWASSREPSRSPGHVRTQRGSRWVVARDWSWCRAVGLCRGVVCGVWFIARRELRHIWRGRREVPQRRAPPGDKRTRPTLCDDQDGLPAPRRIIVRGTPIVFSFYPFDAADGSKRTQARGTLWRPTRKQHEWRVDWDGSTDQHLVGLRPDRRHDGPLDEMPIGKFKLISTSEHALLPHAAPRRRDRARERRRGEHAVARAAVARHADGRRERAVRGAQRGVGAARERGGLHAADDGEDRERARGGREAEGDRRP